MKLNVIITRSNNWPENRQSFVFWKTILFCVFVATIILPRIDGKTKALLFFYTWNISSLHIYTQNFQLYFFLIKDFSICTCKKRALTQYLLIRWLTANRFDARKVLVFYVHPFPNKKKKNCVHSPEPTPPLETCPTRAAPPRPDSRVADPTRSSRPSGCSSPCRRRRRGRHCEPPRAAALCRRRWYSLPHWSALQSLASPLHTKPLSLRTNNLWLYYCPCYVIRRAILAQLKRPRCNVFCVYIYICIYFYFTKIQSVWKIFTKPKYEN